MATDATGTPTSPDGIPTYNTAVDAPSGKGFNAAMAAVQTGLSARAATPPHSGPTRQLLIASGTYTTPAGVKEILVEVVAGGGGGGGNNACSAAQISAGGGGGGGGYASVLIPSPSASYAVVVGAGGIAGGTGGTGGTTSFGATICAATGGIGGSAGNNGVGSAQGWFVAGGAGGAGTNGDVKEPGGPGCPGIQLPTAGASAVPIAGNGGNSYLGGGALVASANANGTTATGHGGGGAGASTNPSGPSTNGGVGAPGIIIVTEFYF